MRHGTRSGRLVVFDDDASSVEVPLDQRELKVRTRGLAHSCDISSFACSLRSVNGDLVDSAAGGLDVATYE